MPQAIETSMNASTAYATSDDFCRIFSEEMDSLYLLSLLLTADAGKAEQCFVAGIGDSVEGNPVFKEWAQSWARRTVIQQAVRTIEPMQETLTIAQPHGLGLEPRLSAILELNPLDRFVFVMSVLEGYSNQDCSILLGCSRQTVVNARTQAFLHLAKPGEIVALQGERLQSTYALVSR